MIDANREYADDHIQHPDTAALFKEVMESNSVGLVITDAEGNVEYANPRQCRETGYALEELIGQNARIFKSGQTSLAVYQTMWTTILAGNFWYGELLNKRKTGELYWEFVHIFPVPDRQGNPRRFFVIKEENLSRRKGEESEDISGIIDHLTGLLNRATFCNRIDRAIHSQEQLLEPRGLIIAHINIDRFHTFNLGLGHALADQLLIELVQRIRQSIRRDDAFARIGGDEFAILFNHHESQEAQAKTIQRILRKIREPVFVAQYELVVTASIGVAYYPRDGGDTQSLLNNAYSAMTVAKQEGGDTACFHEPLKKSVTVEQLDLTRQLRHAADRGELVLHYQPQLSLISGEIVGLEALVRWNRPGIGLVAPGVFIPVAEETGLIIPIGEWVLREAIAQIIAWQKERLAPIKVAVNLSANHFHNISLPDRIEALLKETGVPPQWLELELTESAMMRDAVRVKKIVDRLKMIGVQISLDDFGTGHSSLAYLSRFSIDQLKIDRSFVEDITTNPINASIVAATIAMAHKLGKSVIAEGVETEAQMSFLRRHDCDQIQGFLFSPPRPADEIATMLRERSRWNFLEQDDRQQTLLLIDDEPHVLASLKRAFHRQGYRILTASNGFEALELLAGNVIQVVISDQRMPGMTGIELLSRVKQMYPDTIRIILSGYAELSTVTEAINQGAVWKYLTKPWSGDSLREVVRHAFRQWRGRT